jgi:hypothetical protein
MTKTTAQTFLARGSGHPKAARGLLLHQRHAMDAMSEFITTHAGRGNPGASVPLPPREALASDAGWRPLLPVPDALALGESVSDGVCGRVTWQSKGKGGVFSAADM